MRLSTRFKYFIAFMFITAPLMFAQTTVSVSQQIVDTDGQAWNNGTWSAYAYRANGSIISGTSLSGGLSGTGVLTATFQNTGSITPVGALYQVTICSNTSAPCAVITQLQVTTTTPFPTVPAPRFAASPTAYGYINAEVNSTPAIGIGYFNTVSLSPCIWNGSAFNCGVGGVAVPGSFSTLAVGSASPVQGASFSVYNNTASGANIVLQSDNGSAYTGISTYSGNNLTGSVDYGLLGGTNYFFIGNRVGGGCTALIAGSGASIVGTFCDTLAAKFFGTVTETNVRSGVSTNTDLAGLSDL